MDPSGILPADIPEQFVAVKLKYGYLFVPAIGRYNGASDAIEVRVNSLRQLGCMLSLRMSTYLLSI